eukprot:14059425-Ditylum_brightwellii.AAC.1
MSGCSMYAASPQCIDYRRGYTEQSVETYASGPDHVLYLRCYPGEGKKWAGKSEHRIQQPVCNTNPMGRVVSTWCLRPLW